MKIQKKLFEPLTDTNKNTPENLTQFITETSVMINKALENLNEDLELMRDKRMIAPFLACALVNLCTPENISQFKSIKDRISNTMNEFFKNKRLPVSLYFNILTFRDSNKSFKLDGDL